MARDNDVDAALALLVLLMLTQSKPKPIVWGAGWHWPVLDLVDSTAVSGITPAVISQEFRAPDHLGLDIMYRGALGWFAPIETPIVAARDGVVWSTGEGERGKCIVLAHAHPFATFYQHLAVIGLGLKKGVHVKAGQQIGVMGISPTDAAHIRHLHFAVWHGGHGNAFAVDPTAAMRDWRRGRWKRA